MKRIAEGTLPIIIFLTRFEKILGNTMDYIYFAVIPGNGIRKLVDRFSFADRKNLYVATSALVCCLMLGGCASRPALHEAVFKGDSAKVDSLVQGGADIDKKDSHGWTPLMYALRYKQPDSAKMLIEKGANINAPNPSGWTPLMFALRNDQPDNAKLLIEKGANIDDVSSDGWTPLMFALRYEQPDNAKLLIEKGANIDDVLSDGWTPLMFALRYDQPDNAKLLIEKGAEFDGKNSDGWTPLLIALRYDQPGNAKLLIEKGANVYEKLPNGWTPLLLSLRYGQPDNARLLIEQGANIHTRDSEGWTPLLLALRYGQPDNARLLIEQGASIHAKSSGGWTPLMIALRYDQPGNAKLLIEKGANISEEDSSGITPLIFAAGYSDPGNVELLIANGANVNQEDHDGESPLMYALRNNRTDNVRVLCGKGVSAKDVDADGNTPLIFLAGLDNPVLESAKLLLGNGVNIDQVNNNGDTAFKLACRNGNEALATFLYKNGADTVIEDDSKEGQELNGIKYHIIGDYQLANDEIDPSRESYLKAKKYYAKTLDSYDSDLNAIAVKNFFAAVAVQVLSAAAQQYQAKQSYAQSRQMAQMSALKYADKTNTGLAGYSAYMQNFKPTYTPTLGYAHLGPPASISEKSNTEEKRAYAKAKMNYFSERLDIINTALGCYDSGDGSDVHKCIQNTLEEPKQQ